MSLKDALKEVVEDFNKRRNKSEVWKTLEEKLKKAGFKSEYEEMVHETDTFEAYEFLKIWDAINEHLNKKGYTWSNKRRTFEIMKTLSKIDDIEEVIKTVAGTGYELYHFINDPVFRFKNYICLQETELEIFETLAKDGLYKKYDSVFKALSKFGYKNINGYKDRHTQLSRLISLASLEGDVVGAIYALANTNHKIDYAEGLVKLDIKSIKKIIEEDEKERTEGKGGISVYLYNYGNLELFQDYFISLKVGDKKSVLKSILEYETKQEPQEQNKVRDWLEKNYKNLIREIGFEDVKWFRRYVKEYF